ncbi:MAG TPA: UbiA family prenyltransferase [Saprospiraceae bacterium]|nr:UbiA family prenyltransferase [Saprospiraceae bacterium]HMP24931.1 UbiA family prenyltransferase [Saprospiraceae bacterium]
MYNNLWIAAGALALCLQTQYLLIGAIVLTPWTLFVFFATLLLYALHRLVGLRLTTDTPRYQAFIKYRKSLIISAIVGIIGSLLFFLQLNPPLQIMVLPVAFLSLGYALPILPGGRRLRDLPYLKVVLVAGCWAVVTVVLPAMEYHILYNIPMWLMALERMLYIFAFAIAFDIRDVAVDRQNEVRTLPGCLGIKVSKSLSYSFLCFNFFIIILNYQLDAYAWQQVLALALSTLFCAILIYFTTTARHDYYFIGLLDGLLLYPLFLLWLCSFL